MSSNENNPQTKRTEDIPDLGDVQDQLLEDAAKNPEKYARSVNIKSLPGMKERYQKLYELDQQPISTDWINDSDKE